MDGKPEKVIEAATSQLGSPYVFGAWGEMCTPANRGKRVREDHPATKDKCQVLNGRAPDCTGCEWQGDRMFDCRGFTHWCLKQVGIILSGQGATSQYNNKDNWIERGKIEDMPECVCCVFVADGSKKSHTGLYVCDNKTIEASVTVKQQSLAGKWTHYAVPKGLYTQEELEEIRAEKHRPRATIRKGSKGDDVRFVQETLNELGYNCGKADGIFGAQTLAAVKAFQEDRGLIPDGIVGEKTWEALVSDGDSNYYTATISHLSYREASKLITQFPDSVVVTMEVPTEAEALCSSDSGNQAYSSPDGGEQ